MARSLRWRLQVWHTLTLLVVVAGFASVLYYQIRRARLEEIDAELHAAARTLEGTLRAFPPHVLDGFEGRPPPPFPGRDPPPLPKDRPERDNRPGDRPRPEDRLRRELALPESFRRRYNRDDREAPYFAIFLHDGKLFKAYFPPGAEPLTALPRELAWGNRPFLTHQRGPFREGVLNGPHESRILVGRPIERELNSLAWLGWQLATTGLVVLAVGVAGGLLLSAGAVRPIERMSAAAAGISASNLSQRIDVAGVDSELGNLATILNDMFARLQTAFERQARFTVDASHELRTPLSIIQSHAELALTRPRTTEEYREAIQTSLRAARRMRNLVDGLLTLARVDAGNLVLQRQEIDLGALVAENVGLVESLAERKGVVLQTAVEQVQIVGDPVQLSQVVTNLLANAIDYNRAGGLVTTSLTASEQAVVLSVADSGCGIPEEDQRHIFERFYRVDKARSRDQGGCGLGLAICKSIVEAHGGSICFTSAVERGTTFLVRFPRNGQDAGARPTLPMVQA